MSLCMIEAIALLVVDYLWTRYVTIRPKGYSMSLLEWQ